MVWSDPTSGLDRGGRTLKGSAGDIDDPTEIFYHHARPDGMENVAPWPMVYPLCPDEKGKRAVP